jgi:hypothetical protein
MIYGMNKARLVRSWAALGEARPSFDEYERAMTRPVRTNQYGYVSAMEIYDWVFREECCWSYFRLRHRLCSRRVAQLKAAERRPRYYATENERRRALASERRKIRERTTTNACPTPEAVLEAWNRRRDSHEAAIRFGSLLEDLECYLDNSLRRDEYGVIVGRNPGVKGWLCDNIPEILDKYTTAMRYKAAAKKLKQVAELADPTPADVVLPLGGTASAAGTAQACAATGQEGSEKQDYGADEVMASRAGGDGGALEGRGDAVEGRGDAVEGHGGTIEGCGEGEVPELAVVRARAIWLEVVAGIGPSATALMRRLDALTDPERVEEANMLAAWREKYMNEITVRTKKRWWKRLVKKALKNVA